MPVMELPLISSPSLNTPMARQMASAVRGARGGGAASRSIHSLEAQQALLLTGILCFNCCDAQMEPA